MNHDHSKIELLPIEMIHIANPRARNPKLFENVVQNIAKVGLKRPITVTRRKNKGDGKQYDLVCGQGRLEAFVACGQHTIPAMVIKAGEQQALVMSLVENIARRKHEPIDLLQGVEILVEQGYKAEAIAQKTGYTISWVYGVLELLKSGEERLVTAVEMGQIPLTLAMRIVQSPEDEQSALLEAYEAGEISGQRFITAKSVLEISTNILRFGGLTSGCKIIRPCQKQKIAGLAPQR